MVCRSTEDTDIPVVRAILCYATEDSIVITSVLGVKDLAHLRWGRRNVLELVLILGLRHVEDRDEKK